jgi:hypothetical protein
MKVRLLQCFINYYVMNKYGVVEEQLHIFLTLKLYGREWLVSRLGKYFLYQFNGKLRGYY